METQVPPYSYQPFTAPHKIRVLHLLQAVPGDIQCRLEVKDFSEGGYQALSYVWGSDEKLHTAVVKDENELTLGSLLLTKNLSTALLDLFACNELKSKVFWVDQICIDQQSAEKGRQVAMMGDIYRSADRVITYIGRGGDGISEERGIKMIEQIYDHSRPILEQFKDCIDMGRVRMMTVRLEKDLLPNVFMQEVKIMKRAYKENHSVRVPNHWVWLFETCHGEWLERLWMVQEQLLNPTVVMLRGPRLLSWEAVATTGILLELTFIPPQSAWERPKGESTNVPLWQELGLNNCLYWVWRGRRERELVVNMQNPPHAFNFHFRLLNQLSSTYFLRCRDPRDRVYALLSISSDAGELGIIPDYSLSNTTENVFREVTSKLLRHSNDLQILGYATQGRNTSNTYPSWVLDASDPYGFLPLRIIWGPSSCVAHPQMFLQSQPRFSNDGSMLLLKGRVVDNICTATTPLCLADHWLTNRELAAEQFLAPNLDIICTIGDLLTQRPIDLQACLSICNTITLRVNFRLKSNSNDRDEDEDTVFCFWCWLRQIYLIALQILDNRRLEVAERLERCRNLMITLAAFFMTQEATKTWTPEIKLNFTEWTAFNKLFPLAQFHGRSIGFTQSGRIFSAMHGLEEGDVVVALEGSGVLWTLRPLGDKYRLIGDMFVDGLMQGEAYEGLNSDEVDYDIKII
jgi:hypothetical protein